MRRLIITLFALATGTREIEPIYWHVENQSFSQNFTRHVNLQEKMDIFCPMEQNSEQFHYQTIYLVDQYDFDQCKISDNAIKIITCSNPEKEKKYTMIFQEVNPNPFGLEFAPNNPYYLITTSMGDLDGMSNLEGGLCSMYSMRLKLFVHPGESDGVKRIEDSHGQSQTDFSDDRFKPSRGLNPSFYEVYQSYEENAEQIPVNKQQTKNNSFSITMMVAGIILGVLLIVFMLLVGFLTRRAIENRKRTDSIPTLSEYQSSTIEKSLSHMSNYHPTYHPLPQAHSPHIVPVINTGHLVTIGPDGHYSHQGNSHYGHNKDFVVLPDMNRFVKSQLSPVEHSNGTLKSASSEFRYIDVAKMVSNRENGSFVAL